MNEEEREAEGRGHKKRTAIYEFRPFVSPTRGDSPGAQAKWPMPRRIAKQAKRKGGTYGCRTNGTPGEENKQNQQRQQEGRRAKHNQNYRARSL